MRPVLAQQVWESLEGPAEGMADIVYGNGVFVGLGESSMIYVSSDGGEHWKEAVLGNGDFLGSYGGLIFDGSRFCVIAEGWSATSTDGLNWTLTRNDLEGFTKLIHAVPGLYLAVVQTGGSFVTPGTTIWRSEDLITWTEVASLSGWYYGIMTDGETIFIKSQYGYIQSTDGIEWESLESDLTYDSWLIGYAHGKYFAREEISSSVLYSTDGLAWHAVSRPSSADQPIGPVMEFGEMTVLLGRYGFMRSSGGQFFQGGAVPEIKAGLGMSAAVGDGRIVVSCSGGPIVLSSDAINWSLAEGTTSLFRFTLPDDPVYGFYNSYVQDLLPVELGHSGEFVFAGYQQDGRTLVRVVGQSPGEWQYPSAPEPSWQLNYLSWSIVYFNGYLYGDFIVGDSQYPFYSTDGLNWSLWPHPDTVLISPSYGDFVVNGYIFDTSLSYFQNADFAYPGFNALVTSMAYGDGYYVAVDSLSDDTVFISTTPDTFDAYNIAGIGSTVFYLGGHFVFPGDGVTYQSTGGLEGASYPQIWTATGEAINTWQHARAGDLIFALHSRITSDLPTDVTSSDLIYSEDGINFLPCIGAPRQTNGVLFSQTKGLQVIKSGDYYYLMGYYGTLLRAPIVAATPTEDELLAGVPDSLTFTQGTAVDAALATHESIRRVLITDLPLGLSLDVSTGALSGTPLEAAGVTAMVFVVTDTRIAQKQVTFTVSEPEPVDPRPIALRNAQAFGDFYFLSDWFGGFYKGEPGSNFLFTEDFGWTYIIPESTSESMWWYSFQLESWMWGSEATGRYFYMASYGIWLYVVSEPGGGAFILDTSSMEWFFLPQY